MNRRQSKLVLVYGLIALASQVAFAAPVQWSGNGHWYEVVVIPAPGVTWHEAKAAAEENGGYLATITSADENQFVFDLTVNTPGAWEMSAEWAIGPYLGGYQDRSASDYSEPSGGWRWVTEEPWEYTAWLQQPHPQPDNWLDLEDYLFYWGYPNQIMPTWNDGGDVPCTRYVIEYDPETPTVEIQCDFDTIFISNPTSKSPSYQIDALASPPGGSFNWEIISGKGSGKGSGKEKIKFLSAAEGELANHVLIQGTAPSNPDEMYGDVEIKVTYTIDSQTDDDSIYISVVKPSSLSVHAIDPLKPFGLGGYVRVYRLQVNDQKGNPLTRVMNVDEKRKKVYPKAGKWKDVPLLSAGGPTDENGIWPDTIGLSTFAAPDFYLKVEQQILVDGWDAGIRCQVYHALDAESWEGPCE